MKQYLRKIIQEKLSAFPAHELQEQSQKAINYLINSPFYESSTVVCLYLPMTNSKNKEINTIPLIYDCLNKKKKCFVPNIENNPKRTKFGSPDMSMLEIQSVEDLENNFKMNKWGILEPLKATIPHRKELFSNIYGIPLPEREKFLSSSELLQQHFNMQLERDTQILKTQQNVLVVVPGLGFSLKGERLGRGAGFYDKFLSDLKRVVAHDKNSTFVKGGLCFDFQLLDSVPTESHDEYIDYLATQDGLFECQKE